MSVDLIIGGASKAGTTALYDMLCQCPDFFLPFKKELHFFSWPELSLTTAGPGDNHVMAEIPQTLPRYLSHYRRKNTEQIGVDVSPSYLFHYKSAGRIARTLAKARLVFILRHPVDKVFSQYVHLVAEGRETLDFKDALAQEEKRGELGYSDIWLYRSSGFYADAIAYFKQTLGDERVKIILFEDFCQNPDEVLADLCRYVGLDGSHTFNTNIKVNVSGVPKSLMLARLIAPNQLTRILRRMLPTSAGGLIRRLIRNANRGVKPNLSPDIYANLMSIYEGDIQRLEILIGRSTGWLNHEYHTKQLG